MNTDTQPVSNAIETVLRTQRKGKMLSDLTEAMQRAVQAAREHGADASITLTLKIAPHNAEEGSMSVTDSIKTKLPEKKNTPGLFYATDDGCLVRHNPRQTELQLAVASTPDRAPVAVPQTATA